MKFLLTYYFFNVIIPVNVEIITTFRSIRIKIINFFDC